MMTVARSVADVLDDHVVFEVECLEWRRFARDQGVPWVDFVKGARKDDIMHQHLAVFTGTEGVLFIGRAQEKTSLFRTEKRRDAEGRAYPWIVKTTGVVNHFYVYAVDDDFGIATRLTNLPALREIGISANRRLLGVQRLSHNPIRAAEAFTAVHDPIVTADGHRIAGIRLGDHRAHALLHALLVFRLLSHGFLNRDLRGLLAGLLGNHPSQISASDHLTQEAGLAA